MIGKFGLSDQQLKSLKVLAIALIFPSFLDTTIS
ncbi:hypothetical protein CLIM01_00782 [Colletotrichum limetticola]|uniref:Uncharacterized protein n=1 Tax=Colletotrichum limetticola TaxID=1209924 RepID=A0ABQ9QDH9_9PEZI|nr:hypothetical protein CLIM01_00782 [Colletotrichum limetticola]